MTDLAPLAESIKDALGAAITGTTLARGELTIEVNATDILAVMAHLHGAGDFKILVDICGNDWPQRAKRFDVVYHLLSLTKNVRLRVKTQVGEGESIASVIPVYPAAGFVADARAYGLPTCEINLEAADNAELFDEQRYGPASETVPAWVEEVVRVTGA